MLRHKVLVEARSRREVALEMGVSRNTVRKYLDVPEPGIQVRGCRHHPKYEEIRERLSSLYEAWSGLSVQQPVSTQQGLDRGLVVHHIAVPPRHQGGLVDGQPPAAVAVDEVHPVGGAGQGLSVEHFPIGPAKLEPAPG